MKKLKQYEKVERFFKHFRNPDDSLAGGINTYATPSEFMDIFRMHVEQLVWDRLKSSITAENVTTLLPWEGSPYPGLRAFTRDEATIFFGRGRETDALIAQLRDSDRRFLVVVGLSGTGKSSLVYAGLLPRLAEGAIEGTKWRALSFKPGSYGDNPFLALASALNLLCSHTCREPIEIAEALAKAPSRARSAPGGAFCARITEYIDQALAGVPAQDQLVVFVDQLEELFAQTVGEAFQKGFVDLLAEAAGHPRGRVLATLRADFLPRATRYLKLADLLRTSTFVLGPPGHASLTDMIRCPAQLARIMHRGWRV